MAIATGTINGSDQSVVLDTTPGGAAGDPGYSGVSIQVTGTWSGTLVYDVSVDGQMWYAAETWGPTGTSSYNSTTANGLWFTPIAGFNFVRVRASAWSSGSASVRLSTFSRLHVQPAGSGGGGGGTVTQGAGGTSAWKVDGSAVTQPVSGTVTANAGSGTFTVSGTVTANAGTGTLRVDPTGTTPQPVTGTFWQATQPVSGTVTANQGGTWTVQPGNTANTTAWKVDGSAVTQPVSGTVTANAGTGTFAVSGTVTANAGTGVMHVDDNAASLTVDGTVAATQSGTWNIGTVTTLTGITNVVHVDDNAGSLTVDGTVIANRGFRDGATSLAPVYSVSHITSKTTTTPTAATAYVAAIAICVTGAGSSWSLNIKDKQATPATIYTAAAVAVGNTYITPDSPFKFTNGIDIVTAGTTAGTMDVFITYYQ